MAQIVKSKMHWPEKYGRIAAEGELYFVQKIWERRTELDGTRSYLVSWKGYPSSERNWEPQENFFCPESRALVEQFDEEKDREETEETEHKCLKREKKSSEKQSPNARKQQHFDEELQDALDYLFGANIPDDIREALEANKASNASARPVATTNKRATRKSDSNTPQHNSSLAKRKAASQALEKITRKTSLRSSNKKTATQPGSKTSSSAYTRRLRSHTSACKKRKI